MKLSSRPLRATLMDSRPSSTARMHDVASPAAASSTISITTSISTSTTNIVCSDSELLLSTHRVWPYLLGSYVIDASISVHECTYFVYVSQSKYKTSLELYCT